MTELKRITIDHALHSSSTAEFLSTLKRTRLPQGRGVDDVQMLRLVSLWMDLHRSLDKVKHDKHVVTQRLSRRLNRCERQATEHLESYQRCLAKCDAEIAELKSRLSKGANK